MYYRRIFRRQYQFFFMKAIQYMNHINVKPFKTRYDYFEDYLIIDGIPIVSYLEQHKPVSLSMFHSLLGLLPAWSGKLIWQWENDFIWEMVNSLEELNVPILVCEDDCDLSCIVIVAHIHKDKNTVYWDKIGLLNHSNINRKEYEQSGILCLEAYTEEDWIRYGDNIAQETYGSSEYWKWVSENCYEENIRKLRNYLKPYLQKDQNIEWIWNPEWQFQKELYEVIIQYYQKLKNIPTVRLKTP